MGAHPLLSNHTPLYSLEWTGMRAYLTLQGSLDRVLDTTVHECTLCGLRYGGFDLLMHLHFLHNLAYSDICPCDECVVVQLKEALAGDWQHVSEFSESSGQMVNGMHVVLRRDSGPAMDVSNTQRHFASVKASPALSSPSKHAAKGALAQQETLARMSGAQIVRVDSLSPALMQPSQFAPATPSQNKIKTTPVKRAQHSRVDSGFSMQSMPAPPPVTKPSKPVRGKSTLVPDEVAFYQPPDTQISEKNLTYEVSKIECGEMWQEDGKVIWTERRNDPPTWLDINDNIVVSIATGRNMKWFDFLPHNIPKDVPGWQLACWFREAASQGLVLKQKDLEDRGLSISSSGMSGRITKWQSGVGMLSEKKHMSHNWPSKQAMETVANLTYTQALFNTWWDVEYISSHKIWMVRQPGKHPVYKDWASLRPDGPKTESPYYFIENPETRAVSEYVKLIDDAMLFLTIKAEECGMTNGYHEMLHWFARQAADQWVLNLEADLIVEFGRWREGCRDTPSVAVLRAALEEAGSVAEIEAIKRADYSLTPWLQDVERGLAPFKQSRRSKDAQKKIEVTTKGAKMGSQKRKIEEVEGVEMYGGEAKKRAMEAVMAMYK